MRRWAKEPSGRSVARPCLFPHQEALDTHDQPRHPLEALVDHVAAAVEAEEHPAEMAVCAVAGLACRRSSRTA